MCINHYVSLVLKRVRQIDANDGCSCRKGQPSNTVTEDGEMYVYAVPSQLLNQIQPNRHVDGHRNRALGHGDTYNAANMKAMQAGYVYDLARFQLPSRSKTLYFKNRQ